MEQMKGREKVKEEIVGEYLRGDISLRELGARYGIGHSTVNRWVKAAGEEAKGKIKGGSKSESQPEENLALEVKRLRQELREAELHNKLLNAMIEIAEERFEIPIRKKSGPRQ